MTTGFAVITSIGLCIVAAALEGVCAGSQVKPFFAKLRFPPYSAPLWLWSIIGGLYYVIFGFVLYRLLRLGSGSALRSAALALILFMMVVNALTNYIIFRAQDLRLSFMVGALFPVMDVMLFICLTRLDQAAAWWLMPYLLYRVYAVWWGYGLWKLNGGTR
ncbi:MAG TPA: TspO/MBR family protein [Blastocatellia bacterium]|nr:TspO/MBR family protein [Blastocatellia bacterium]